MSLSTVLRYGLLNSVFPTSGLTSYWRMNETSGMIASDAIGSIDGTVNNSIVLGSTGFHNNGADFTQGNDYINLEDSKTWGKTMDEFSFSYWYKSDEITDNNEQYVLASINFPELPYLFFQLGFHMKKCYYQFFCRDTGNSNGLINGYYNQSIDDGDWHHVVLTYSYSDNETDKFYIDGVLQTPTSSIHRSMASFADNDVDFQFDFYLGARSLRGTVDAFTDCKIDELGVWNRALTTEEVQTIYNSGSGLFY